MRKATEQFYRKVDGFRRRFHTQTNFRPVKVAQLPDGIRNDVECVETGVEALGGILKDHLDLSPKIRAHKAIRVRAGYIVPVDPDAAGCGIRKATHYPGKTIFRNLIPHQSHCLTGHDRKTDIIHCVQDWAAFPA